MSARSRSVVYVVLLVTALLAPGMAFPQRACVYTSHALPDSVVPPLQGEGWGYMQLLDDRDNCDSADPVWLYVGYGNLASSTTGASIHRGIAGQNGDLICTLYTKPFEPGTEIRTDLDPAVCWEIFNQQGTFYFIISTVDHPDGAVRGQVWTACQSPTFHSTWGRIRCSYR
jgi:hypothetical protein